MINLETYKEKYLEHREAFRSGNVIEASNLANELFEMWNGASPEEKEQMYQARADIIRGN